MDSLATKKEIYELTMVDVKPECWKQYVTHKGIFPFHDLSVTVHQTIVTIQMYMEYISGL